MAQILQHDDIFSYIKAMENQYRLPIRLNDSWDWGMRDHIQTTELYTNSQLKTGKTDFKPVKNITRPILNLQHRTEDIELKDVQIYVDNPEKFHLSFLVKKYHDDVFVKENDLDTFFDELNVSRIDYGGGLSKKLNKPCPEVVPLQSIAFCDQTDILSGPIGIKHYYSPDQLLEMKDRGWGEFKNGATHSIEELIELSREEKRDTPSGQLAQTPGRYIEVYEVHGNLPARFANLSDHTGEFETRIFIVCFYTPIDSTEHKGVILYTQPEKESPFKLIKRDPVHGRALGFGGAEELFEAQVWVNYDMIRMQNMLDASSVTILKSTDPAVAAKHPSGLKNLKNMEVLDIALGTDIAQVDTYPRNMKIFEESVLNWEAHAQQMGAANDSIMGEAPKAGTPFKLQELVTQESHGLHEYRRQQYAKHLEEIYNDWIIPHIQKKITEGHKFLSELSLDELQYVSECLVRTETNKKIIEMVLNGEEVNEEEIELFKSLIKDEFKKKGNKHFIEILKGEFKGENIAVKVSVAGKSKNMAQASQAYTNILREIRSTDPRLLAIPAIGNIFNQALESSGLSPVDFSDLDKLADQLAQSEQPQPSPVAPQMQNA